MLSSVVKRERWNTHHVMSVRQRKLKKEKMRGSVFCLFHARVDMINIPSFKLSSFATSTLAPY